MADSTPKITRKSFTYTTNIEWLGGRAGTTASEGKQAFRTASPPEFKGEAGVWTPEDLYVAAVNACTMTTFAAFSLKAGLNVLSYESDATGTLEFVEGGYRFTKVVIRPRIVVSSAEDAEKAKVLIHDAHDGCIVSKSMRAEVVIAESVEVRSK